MEKYPTINLQGICNYKEIAKGKMRSIIIKTGLTPDEFFRIKDENLQSSKNQKKTFMITPQDHILSGAFTPKILNPFLTTIFTLQTRAMRASANSFSEPITL